MAFAPTDCPIELPPALLLPTWTAPVVPDPVPARPFETVNVWGLPLARLDTQGTLELVNHLIRRGRPGFFITANLHYARLTAESQHLRELNRRAAFITADGMPLVWQARRQGQSLPERVTGSDLVHHLCRQAAIHGHRVFFLGGKEGVAREAARQLKAKNPLLAIAGVAAPVFSEMTPDDHAALVASIRATRPDIVLAALGQPKGEIWLDRHCHAIGAPVCVQIGASLDFVAGRARRAPRWTQRCGLEWFHRMATDPRRLAPRYTRDALFLARTLWRGVPGN